MARLGFRTPESRWLREGQQLVLPLDIRSEIPDQVP